MTWFKAVTFICLLVALSVAFAPGVRAEWSRDYPLGKIMAGNELGQVTCVEEYNGEIYVGGYFSKIGGKELKSIAKWDGYQWTSVGINGFTYFGGVAWIKDLVVYDGKLFAGGIFDLIDGHYTYGIAMWDGEIWKDVLGGIGPSFSGGHPSVNALMIHDGLLVVGGNFVSVGNMDTDNIGAWDGQIWHKYGSGTPQIVHCLTEFQGSLYAGGATTNPDPVQGNAVWVWTGTSWSSVTLEGVGIGVFALAEYRGNLIAGGTAFYTGGALAIKYGNQWYQYGGECDLSARVSDIEVYRDNLIISGWFDYLDGDPTTPIKNVARWDGGAWHDLDLGLYHKRSAAYVYEIMLNDDGFLAVGDFSYAGGGRGIFLPGLATWTFDAIELIPKSVSALQIPDLYGGATWEFSWKTNNYSDPLLDKVVVRDNGNDPDCMIGEQTFTHNEVSVIIKVTLQSDGTYLHEATVLRNECAPGCDYLFDVSSRDDGFTASSTNNEWNTGYCIAMPPSMPAQDNAALARNVLEQNHPNPFNPSTVIGYEIASDANVTLAIYDVTGKLVRTLVNEFQMKRAYNVTWDGRDNMGTPVASGAYFYRLETPTFTETRKLLLLK
jgi:hypothetical protein